LGRLVRKAARVVREMPLWRLQRIGSEQLNFLYDNQGDGRVVQLRPGVVFCFRKLHALISDLVRGAWVSLRAGRISACSVKRPT
jgi:hypothetical protein